MNLMELKVCLCESLFGYYDELKLASKSLLGTLAPFGPGASKLNQSSIIVFYELDQVYLGMENVIRSSNTSRG